MVGTDHRGRLALSHGTRFADPRSPMLAGMTFDLAHWRRRLDDLRREHDVPAASLAVLVDDDVHTVAGGMLNVETGVAATPDAVFQIGSTTKVYTATAIMRLAEAGRLDLDAPLTEVLPELRVADPEVTARVTARHLLTHTSGIAGDVFTDTGRGDDAVARYVEACATLGQDVPFQATFSYCNTGFVILGRVVERLAGATWEEALAADVLRPLGLRETVAHPEDALRRRWAFGHVPGPDGPAPAPIALLPRSSGPAGGAVWASARDVVAFARLFLDEGRARDGMQVLGPTAVAEMLRPQVPVAERWSSGDFRGLGWQLDDRGGRRVFLHGGATIGQRAFLEVVPDRRVAVALLTNGGGARSLAAALYAELLAGLCDVETPVAPRPVEPAQADPDDQLVGVYERYGSRTEIAWRDGELVGTDRLVEPLASQLPGVGPVTFELRRSDAGPDTYVARDAGEQEWRPVVLFDAGGDRYLHTGGRAQRKLA